MGLFVLIAAAVWLVALCELVVNSSRDTGSRVLLAVLLLVLPPAGLFVWLVVKRGEWRERRALRSVDATPR
jgi:hypothetical protein